MASTVGVAADKPCAPMPLAIASINVALCAATEFDAPGPAIRHGPRRSFMPPAFVHGRTILAALALLVPVSAAADDPKTYSCNFTTGAAMAYEGGTFKPEKVGPIAFDIANVNAELQSADLVTPAGSRPLRVVRAINAMHFLEVVGEGFLNMTTVYDRDDAKGEHPAVHSRHFGILGQPVIGQYQGFCKGS
jgi:hypothetical protein